MTRSLAVALALGVGACAASPRGGSEAPTAGRLSVPRAATPEKGKTEPEVGLKLNWPGVSSAKPSCSTVEKFSQQVSSRLSGRGASWWTSLLTRDLEVRVTVSPIGDRWRGGLQLRGAVEAERTVVGEACGEVITALALITALRLRELSVPPTRVERPTGPVAKTQETPRQAGGREAPSNESPLYAKIALLGGGVSLPVPSAEVSLRADLRRSPHWHSWMWSGALSYQRGNKGRFRTSGVFAQLDLCSPSLARGMWLRACGFGRAGVQLVSVSRSPLGATTPSRTPWGAFGLGVHADISLFGSWSARPFVEALASSSQNEYFVAGIGEEGGLAGADVASFTSPRFGARSGIGLSYEL